MSAAWNRTLWEVQLLASPMQRVVVTTGLALATQADEAGRAAPGERRLAAIAHCSRSAAWSHLRALKAAGWIERDGAGPVGRAGWQLVTPPIPDGGQWISGPAR